jgi:hypothetical protein
MRDERGTVVDPLAGSAAGVWVFNGVDARFSGGIFTTRERPEGRIAANGLTGMLTLYPLDVGVYEWAIARGLFTPKQDKHRTVEFIGGFTTASMEHYHYEDGVGPD